MKKNLFASLQVSLLTCLIIGDLQAQTCSFTDLRLNSQTAVNSFNSSCKTVNGNIIISGADITDLRPLKNIEVIEGRLTIQNNTTLPNLKGLEKLNRTQSLLIYNNGLLVDLSGLEGLTTVQYITHIRFNEKLVNLKGLDNLTYASTLYISNNDLLANLTGLGKLEYVSDLLSVTSNKTLLSLSGLTSLTNVSRIIIGENDILPDLSGLEKLQSVSYQMHVSSNKSLISFDGLSGLTSLSEAYISDNNLVTNMSGLEAVGAVKWLVIGESQGLTSLAGLTNLTSATNFIIRGNNLLTDLSGLENMTSIGWLQVSDNAQLASLSGLGTPPDAQRTSPNGRASASLVISGLLLRDNPSLTTCAISSICEIAKTDLATISGNGTGCENRAAVEVSCASLPVTLTSFTASAESGAALLQWSTTEESNSAFFEVEHSIDCISWQKVGEHTAKGESNELAHYQWFHTKPVVRLNYYRLKMVDLDGSYAHSQIVKVRLDHVSQATMYIYPNPASDVLFVENEGDVTSLLIFNLKGEAVYNTNHIPNEGLSLKKLATGIYQVQIRKQDGSMQTQRIVVL
ncbi:T9SS type A sorting domain-containing protein [Dyadobacter sp. CY107]|uniref:T9SS type A sorting domain-containing protein n=1 Tax=Dyadobacter fanqingshengii TaxID=2906443 RepID=UPI001F2AEB3B|nr:T9SS type A sorting domain-containing protein [Dyadobacter fanqingshengii]MCF2504717.1 T9SS type A sorting domain-containing protein [Dyadobacter fanqingshengii]